MAKSTTIKVTTLLLSEKEVNDIQLLSQYLDKYLSDYKGIYPLDLSLVYTKSEVLKSISEAL